MKAVLVRNPGPESRLELGRVPAPQLGPGEVRLRVAATAVNRADLLQRRGLYPPPPGAPDILGLECSGTVLETAPDVEGWSAGDRAMALLAGGGYAGEVVVPAGCLLPVPRNLSLAEAAAVPEAFLTAHSNLFILGRLGREEWALIHGGSGGVGTAAVQLVRLAGGRAAATAGSEERCARVRDLGAEVALDHHRETLWEELRAAAAPAGFSVILDCIGAAYLERHLELLGMGGRLVIIGLMGGRRAEIDLAPLLGKRLELMGSTLRGRPPGEKARIVEDFRRRFLDAFDDGMLRPVIHTALPLERVEEAHRIMAAGNHFGKIVLVVDPALAGEVRPGTR